MHVMVLDLIRLDRTERAKSHMEGDSYDIDPLIFYLGKKLIGKMKPRRRSCCRPFIFRIYGLIAVLILKFVLDIRRKGHLSESVKHLFKYALVLESDQPVALIYGTKYLCPKLSVSEYHSCSLAKLFPWADETFPYIVGFSREKEYLRMGTCILLDSKEPGRYHLSVIYDQAVSWLKIVNDVPEMPMLDGTGILVKKHEP